MKVRDAMAKTFTTVGSTDSIGRVAQIMRSEDTGFIPVANGDAVVGVITDRDIVVRCLAEGHGNVLQETAEHCMSRDVESIDANAELQDAAHMMSEHSVRRLIATANGHMVGILSHGNLVQATAGAGASTEATLGVTRGA